MTTDLPTATTPIKPSPTPSSALAVDVRPLEDPDFLQIPDLSASAFDWPPTDQHPPWLVQTMVAQGGVAVGAFVDAVLIGYSLSFPGWQHGQRFLYNYGIAVDARFRGQDVATRLLLAHRDHARAAGYELLRWTTVSLNSPALYVYLRKLGARLTALHEDMYLHTLNPSLPDEVGIEWSIRDVPPPRRTPPSSVLLTTTDDTRDGFRRLTDHDVFGPDRPAGPAYLVEIPWDPHELLAGDPAAATNWSSSVRAVIRSLLDAGYVGTNVVLERPEQRSFVQFDPADATGRG